ncbi:MAG: sigma-70 family RNA polymerase sigma factor, partial [Clostridia bacterium]|nr:sigma-70 family RNA polymerase sigma factor [Clostridia bacterium]
DATAKKYVGYLSTVAYNILRSSEDTEEIVNDTYLGAWNAIPPTIPKILRHFLSRITRSLSLSRLDYLTAKKRAGHVLELTEELEECCVRDNYETLELAHLLIEHIESLDKLTRSVFVLRYYYSRTVREIARSCALSERKVKYLLKKARDGLKSRLEDGQTGT